MTVPLRHRTRRLPAVLGVALLTGLSGGASMAAPPAPGRVEIAAAFAHFFGPSVPAAVVDASVEAGAAPLAAALRNAATVWLDGFERSGARLSVQVGAIGSIDARVARVEFTVRVRGGYGPYAQRFMGAAVRSGGAWRVGWTTACFVVETYHVSCPRPPAHIRRLPLPEAQLPARFAHPTALGLIRPEALAVASDGSLVIVDALRNQVLRRSPDGRLHVLAGTGEHGFAGDGGQAVDAELSDPAAVAVAPNGSAYVADTGNGRIRVIAPDGTIDSLPGRFTRPSGLALARDGTLFAATDSSVVQIRPDGTRTVLVTGGGRFHEIVVGSRRYGAFDPSYLALDSNGDLYAFSFGTKTIFEFSRTGRPLHGWPSYANGLAEAPDGSIVVAGHGAALARIRDGRMSRIVDLDKTRLGGYSKPGSFQPDGIAVAKDGTIYADTFVGNGSTNQTALAEIAPDGRGRLLPTTSPLAQTLPVRGASGFPLRLYPQPHHARSGRAPSACPSPRALRHFTAKTRAAAIGAAQRIDVGPLWDGLRLSDRAWWPGLYEDQIDGQYEQGLHRVLDVEPATADPYAAAVARACGRGLLERSLAVTIGPGVFSDQVSHLYFLDRDGHPLVYWQHT